MNAHNLQTACRLPAQRYEYTHNPLTCIGVRAHTHTGRMHENMHIIASALGLTIFILEHFWKSLQKSSSLTEF